MEKEQRTRLQKATQDARRLLEEEFRSQLLQTYDIDVDKVRWAAEPGAHLLAEQRLIREKLIAWIEHKEAQINDRKEALLLALREMAFTALNRFVALKLMEARELVRPCVSGGLESAGFLEFTAVAQGLLADQESSYRLYLETIFEDVSRELRALFDPRDPASLLWPKRTTLLEFLDILNRPELAELWSEDETLGWVYQYFNGDAERKKMREESAAPRNSRELAVRNQFFTPRYVVEFLTDNTLGRIWYEMRQGDTGLKERCRYLVRRPNEIWLQPGEQAPVQLGADAALNQEEMGLLQEHIPHRPLKDPREIRMLDPACGSMHFGLYSFNLYLEIYAEAWEIAQDSDKLPYHTEEFASFIAYVAAFASKAAFLREVPKLILQHNIHGVDIDPRASQIAKLTLWLRAQRAWQEQQLEGASRPPITRSNVVCAEPMPDEPAILADFVDQEFPEAESDLVKELLEAIFDNMQLAGVAGSLLRIEEEISEAIDSAQSEWQRLEIRQNNLFSLGKDANDLGQDQSLREIAMQSLGKDFWITIEERIYSALSKYAEKTESISGFQRRLFAEDAARGFALIDISRKRYDVLLMNPPFGARPASIDDFFRKNYPDSMGDLLGMFYQRSTQIVTDTGKIGAITNRTWLTLPSFEELRSGIIFRAGAVDTAADLGSFVLDAQVEVVAAVIGKGGNKSRMGMWIRLLKTKEKGRALDAAIQSIRSGRMLKSVFLAGFSKFRKLPSTFVGYWIPASLVQLYNEGKLFGECVADVRVGLQTSDDFRFLRLLWEVDPGRIGIKKHWVKFAKGGEYSPYFDDIHLAVLWHNQGKEIVAWGKGRPQNTQYFGKAGVTWPHRTTSHFGPRAFPAGFGFGHKGPVAFPISPHSSAEVLGFLASSPMRLLLSARVGAGDDARGSASKSYDVGLVKQLPAPQLASDQLLEFNASVEKCVAIARSSVGKRDETSNSFTGSAISSIRLHRSIRCLAEARVEEDEEDFVSLTELSEFIDQAVGKALGFGDLEMEVLCEELERPLGELDAGIDPLIELFITAYLKKDFLPSEFLPGGAEAEVDVRVLSRRQRQNSLRSYEDICRLFELSPKRFATLRRKTSVIRDEDITLCAKDILSFALGSAFGRWNVRGVLGSNAHSGLPGPFESMPLCPPVQLLNEQGAPAQPGDICSAYPIDIAWAGIFVGDHGHPLDIAYRVRDAMKVILGSQASDSLVHEIEREACSLLGIDELGSYFDRPDCFFANHLQQYSKSRRQAPIYWLISTGNCSYSVWLYYHRFTQDTLYRVLRDFVEPRIQQAEREQFELESQGGLSGDGAARLQEAQTLLHDLRLLKSELDLVAPLWNPNLDDGVIVNHAILWRITPYAPWQKKCKECWDKLVKGDYDWAHLAFHLWPERVIRSCTTDRSLAIAHGLEERLWQQTNNGNWLLRQLSEADLQALIAEHCNPAVKSALERFLAAPPPVAPTRTRASRSTRASGSSAPRRPRGTATAVDAEVTRQTLFALAAAPAEGLSKNDIASVLDVEAATLTPVIKQLKATEQIEQLGAAKGTKYRLTEAGRAAVASQAEEDD